MPRDAPSGEIVGRADAERKRWMQKTQVTAEKTAWLEVISQAQSHLASADSRARYDRTLALEAEERLNEMIGFAVKGLAKLDYGTRAALIDEASRRGVEPERADVLIGRACRTQGVSRDGAPGLICGGSIEPIRYLRCRSCSGLTDHAEVASPPGRPECRHCRASLQWPCPACKRVRWVDEPRCVCGFQREHVEPLARHFEAAQQAHRDREYANALEHLRRVQQYAPSHPGARKAVETVRRLQGEADAARSACEAARSRRRLVEARDALQEWGRRVPPEAPEYLAAREEVDRGLRMARSLAAKGRAIEGDDPKAARALYDKALGIAADLEDAREGLLRCPPDPPSGLLAEFDVDRVRLRWTPPPPDGLGPPRFRVVRKRGGVPTQPNDGVVVAEVAEAEAEAEDRSVRAGESVGYAVFSIRGEVASRQAAEAGPIDVRPDVRGLRVDSRSGEVALSWTLPDGASGVRVVRNPRRRPAPRPGRRPPGGPAQRSGRPRLGRRPGLPLRGLRPLSRPRRHRAGLEGGRGRRRAPSADRGPGGADLAPGLDGQVRVSCPRRLGDGQGAPHDPAPGPGPGRPDARLGRVVRRRLARIRLPPATPTTRARRPSASATTRRSSNGRGS